MDEQLAAYDANAAQVNYAYARSKNLTRYDVLTLASMIEREVAVPRERPIVAGVMYNRLKAGMRLDIDATVQYALGEWKPELSASDLAIDSPYNTRKFTGLPPGPISNPGLDSIRAAARPAKVPYLYYVARNDGTGRHFFATTPEQFEQRRGPVRGQRRRMIERRAPGWPGSSAGPWSTRCRRRCTTRRSRTWGWTGCTRRSPSTRTGWGRRCGAWPPPGCAGLNVTIPHKQAVIAACSEASEAVRAIGAANTLVPDGDGGFRCDNTDAAGLRAGARRAGARGRRRPRRAAGGGGRRGPRRGVRAARARRAGARGQPHGGAGRRSWATRCRSRCPAMDMIAGDCALVVNCTSLGLHGDDVPPELPMAGIGRGQVVADIVYRPGGTPWLAAAAARGARPVDGLAMLLHQGAAAFEQWTGRPAPVDVMRGALTAA